MVNPQRPAQVFYPAGHPKHRAQERQHPEQPTPTTAHGEVKQSASPASAPLPDLGDLIRGIGELASELHQVFFAIPDVADESGRVDPEKFDASMQQAFISCGNALDYAVRLVAEKRGHKRILQLRKELAEEMRALGMTGDPLGEPSSPPAPPQVG
jgi:hypothetical protein